MKFSRSTESGSMLLISTCTMGVIGVMLASYLLLTSQESTFCTRSQAWNLALSFAEGGIEEGLAHVYASSSGGSMNLAQNGWNSSAGQYTKTASLGSGSYAARIYLSNSAPVIESTGYYPASTGTNYVSRLVRVVTTNSAVFKAAAAVTQAISMSGNNVTVDSFDSSNTSYSTGGRYDSTKRKDKGDLLTTSGSAGIANIGNANIYGKVSTGPGGTVSIGANGAVGSTTWVNGGNHGVQPGWSANNANAAFPDVSAPFSGGYFSPSSGTVSGTNYTYLLNNANYQMSSLSMSGQAKMLVTGNVVLYVTGNLSMSGQSQIILGTGATLKIYVGGATASLAGNGIVGNSNASSLALYGLPTNTSISLGGNAAFTGTMYAPEANISLSGGGNNTYDFVGAIVGNSLSMNGHFNLHFDENLTQTGPTQGYAVTSWTEL